MTSARVQAARLIAQELLQGLRDMDRAAGRAGAFARTPEAQDAQRALRALVAHQPARTPRPERGEHDEAEEV